VICFNGTMNWSTKVIQIVKGVNLYTGVRLVSEYNGDYMRHCFE
jgi:hypothetical protein